MALLSFFESFHSVFISNRRVVTLPRERLKYHVTAMIALKKSFSFLCIFGQKINVMLFFVVFLAFYYGIIVNYFFVRSDVVIIEVH